MARLPRGHGACFSWKHAKHPQARLHRLFQRGVWDVPEKRLQPRAVELDGCLPEIAHLAQFTQRLVERRAERDQRPGESPHRWVGFSHHMTNRRVQRIAADEMAGEME